MNTGFFLLRLARWCLVALCALGAPELNAGEGEEPVQVLVFRLVAPRGITVAEANVEVQRPGETVSVALHDDGTGYGDVPGDGVYTGSLAGAYARYVGVDVMASVQGEAPVMLWSGLEWTGHGREATMSWKLELCGVPPAGGDGDAGSGALVWQALRTVELPSSGTAATGPTRSVLASLAWGGFLLLYIGGLTMRRAAGAA